MNRIDNFGEFYNDALEKASQDENNWYSFLKTAANFYRQGIMNQIIIHGQDPQATVINTARKWVNLGYTIKPGAEEIIILAPGSNAQKQEWEKVIDARFVEDKDGKSPSLEILDWTIPPQQRYNIIHALKNSIANQRNYELPEKLTRLLSNTSTCLSLIRCGFEEDAERMIGKFTDIRSIGYVDVKKIGRPLLQNVTDFLNNAAEIYGQWKTREERNQDGRIFREVRNSEVEIPEILQTTPVFGNEEERGADTPSVGDSEIGSRELRFEDRDIGATLPENGTRNGFSGQDGVGETSPLGEHLHQSVFGGGGGNFGGGEERNRGRGRGNLFGRSEEVLFSGSTGGFDRRGLFGVGGNTGANEGVRKTHSLFDTIPKSEEAEKKEKMAEVPPTQIETPIIEEREHSEAEENISASVMSRKHIDYDHITGMAVFLENGKGYVTQKNPSSISNDVHVLDTSTYVPITRVMPRSEFEHFVRNDRMNSHLLGLLERDKDALFEQFNRYLKVKESNPDSIIFMRTIKGEGLFRLYGDDADFVSKNIGKIDGGLALTKTIALRNGVNIEFAGDVGANNILKLRSKNRSIVP